MAVLVDNFQRTITAVEVKPHKKHSGLQFKSVFDDVSIRTLFNGLAQQLATANLSGPVINYS